MRGVGQESVRAGSGSRLLRQKRGSKLVKETKRWPCGRNGNQNQKAWDRGSYWRGLQASSDSEAASTCVLAGGTAG